MVQDGMTALIMACVKGHHDVAELLLNRDADVEQVMQGEITALKFALYGGHDDVVELLLNRGAGEAEEVAS